jgi:hypothetical protein
MAGALLCSALGLTVLHFRRQRRELEARLRALQGRAWGSKSRKLVGGGGAPSAHAGRQREEGVRLMDNPLRRNRRNDNRDTE